jgi:hypothetical protein
LYLVIGHWAQVSCSTTRQLNAPSTKGQAPVEGEADERCAVEFLHSIVTPDFAL